MKAKTVPQPSAAAVEGLRKIVAESVGWTHDRRQALAWLYSVIAQADKDEKEKNEAANVTRYLDRKDGTK